MKLFEMGRLTRDQAAQLAGVSRVAFLLSCPPWNVPTVALGCRRNRRGIKTAALVSRIV